jgi:hypothetical protein
MRKIKRKDARESGRGAGRLALGAAGCGALAAFEPPAHLASPHAEILLLLAHRGSVLEADDLVEELLAVAAALVADAPPLAVVWAGVAIATPVRIIPNNRCTPTPGWRDSTTGAQGLQRPGSPFETHLDG